MRHDEPEDTWTGEADGLQDGVFFDAVFDRHDGGCGDESQHKADAGIAEVMGHADQLGQVAEALGLEDTLGASVGLDGTALELVVDLLTLGDGIDAFVQKDFQLRDCADKVHALAALKKLKV